MGDRNYEELLREGITAAKNGNREQARRLLTEATRMEGSDARPWIWLSATTDEPEEKRKYLEYAVAADPSDAAARKGLVILTEKLDKSRLVPEGASVEPLRPTAPEEVPSAVYQCSQCGGQMKFEVQRSGLVCQHCGHVQQVSQRQSSEVPGQPIDFVLPTTVAHRWAETQKRVICQSCGAVTLLSPQQKTDPCIYCGSNRLVESAEAGELIDPQAIGLMEVDEDQAYHQVKAWLAKGSFIPDNLVAQSRKLQLRPGYFPFWTFDGTLELPWSCEVNEGSSRYPHWVSRSGSEFEFFDNILVPGLKAMTSEEVAKIGPFNLKELVEFKPEYLVGWQALSYDRTLSDASLLGREEVITKLRRSAYTRVELGRSKRNINFGAGKWSGLTFKHILLPIWTGSYRYRDRNYRVLVNGQTGKSGGEKPQDWLKIFLIGLEILLFLALIVTLVLWILRN
jgi:DNA-directed RNA polymerase subunit RPC12/RpoP